MVQLKSTDAQQITMKQKDIRILEKHAAESHKAPVFAIQFLNTGEVWLMCKQEDLVDAAIEIGYGYYQKASPMSDVLKENGPNRPENVLDDNFPDEEEKEAKKTIKSSEESRKEFYNGFKK